jgi:hypothetical protein
MDSRDMAKVLDRRGRRMRAKRLSAERESQIASLGGASPSNSLRAERRIAENFRYAAAIDSMRDTSPKVTRLKTFKGRLPGIYPDQE